MSIWFYLFLIVLCISIYLTFKILIMKNEIKNIGQTLEKIINTDTNNLITVGTNTKELKQLASLLNNSLKDLRKLELEYKNGSGELKASITDVSHDLRTPLTAIRAYLDLIDDKNLTKKQIEYLSVIDSKVNDLIELTEQLFDFSKAYDKKRKIEFESVCLNDVLEDSLASFYSLFNKNDIVPKVDICKDKVIRLLNISMLKRIFENIISNAIKYGEKDFKVKLSNDGSVVFSNKTDSFDAVSLKKIFDRYYTIKNVKKSNGVGLAIAKQLVEIMGGKVKANYTKNTLTIKVKF